MSGGGAGLDVKLVQAGPIPLNADFTCAPGEVHALVGPSGSGKSTILRCIAGAYRPTGGEVAVGGECWFASDRGVNLPSHKRAVGMVFQSYALFPHMTALANIAAALTHLPPRQREEKARAWLSQVHLAGLEERRPAELSGGQQQRVALARALAREPKALLLDEPFSAVDRATRQRLYREIAELRQSFKMPVVLVTHDLEEAAMLADRLTVIYRGRSLQSGTPEEVMTKPASPEVARLVELRNVFEGRLLDEGPGGNLRIDWGGLELEVRRPAAPPQPGPLSWAIPDGYILLHRRDRPSRGERENPVPGRIESLLVIGQTAQITLRPAHDPKLPLQFSLPRHVAQRNGLEPGAKACVSLLSEGIHLMPERENPL